jgi:sterol desaturase/sphingolipid hydroxylase (fatty acid hydroxylase superfamily)
MNVYYFRLVVFASLLVLMILLEFIWPRRARARTRQERWPENFSITLINSVLSSLLKPLAPAVLALWAQKHEFGLLWAFQLSEIFHVLWSFLLLDLAIYFQHRIFHRIPVLWKLHKVHHSDLDLDVSSGFRFHPFEIILSLVIKGLVIMVLGAHPLGVLFFEVSLSSGSLFNHSNINIKGKVDDFLRLVLVTPDMHRIHHSVEPKETDSNFGFTLSWWDKIFKTYTPNAQKSQDQMVIGLKEFLNQKSWSLLNLLKMPFF